MLFKEKKNNGPASITILLFIFGALFLGGLIWYFSNPQPLIQVNGKNIRDNVTDAMKMFQESSEPPCCGNDQDGAQSDPSIHIMSTSTDKTETEAEVIASMRRNWTLIQTRFSYRPSYVDPTENSLDLWHFPSRLQFIGNGVVVIRMADDHVEHVVYYNYGKDHFLSTIKFKAFLSSVQWQRMREFYGDPKYTPRSWATEVVRNGKMVSFEKLVGVPENVFIKEYWKLEE